MALEGPPAPRRRCRHLRLGLRPRRCGALEAKVLVLRLRTSPPPAMASGVMQTLVDLELPEKRYTDFIEQCLVACQELPEELRKDFMEQCLVARQELPEEFSTDLMEQCPVAYQELPEEPRLRS